MRSASEHPPSPSRIGAPLTNRVLAAKTSNMADEGQPDANEVDPSARIESDDADESEAERITLLDLPPASQQRQLEDDSPEAPPSFEPVPTPRRRA